MAVDAENLRKQKEVDAYINSLAIPEDQKQILRQLSSDTFKTDQKIFKPEEISSMLSTAATNAASNLDPYYSKKTSQEIEDVKNKFADIRSQASLYAQNE